jgi:succinate-semialdehyde dehydrogenase/glutarate-semialdehyde dehydrogenase
MTPMYINGEWVDHSSDGEVIPVLNPATEEQLDTVPNGSKTDAGRAVQAAKKAFQEWRWIPALERAEM